MNDVISNTFIVQNPENDNVRNVLKDYIKTTIIDLYNLPLYVGGNCPFQTAHPFLPSQALQLSPIQI